MVRLDMPPPICTALDTEKGTGAKRSQVMREHKIDMWIQVMREGSPDPLASDLGSNSGVFVFTDRGNNRIERAVFDYSMDLVRECGAYDIIAKPKSRLPLDEFYETYGAEWPGGPARASQGVL